MWQLSNADKMRLLKARMDVYNHAENMLGYPLNMDSPMATYMHGFMRNVLNNLGDPFQGSACKLETFEFEREVVKHFGELFGGRKNVWGYVTSCGSEGNYCGVDAGLNMYPDVPVVFTKAAHYSVRKAVRMARAKAITVDTLPSGAIDVKDLRRKIDGLDSIVLVLTAGTTMTGAVDDVVAVNNCLSLMGVDYYLHVDAALAGAMLPYWNDAPNFGFDAGADSVSVSGHKFYGVPVPCGVYVQRQHPTASCIEYMGTRSSTMFGSRSGMAAVGLWCAIRAMTAEHMMERVRRCREVAEYAFEKLSNIINHVWMNDFSTTVVFRRPADEVAEKYQLACEGDEAHLIVMPHVTELLIDRFVLDVEHFNKGAKAKDAVANIT